MAESMEFSSNRLKQVHMQMYNIWVDGVLQITVLVMNYREQCSYQRNMLEWLQKHEESTILLENSTVRELSLHWAEMNKLNPILS